MKAAALSLPANEPASAGGRALITDRPSASFKARAERWIQAVPVVPAPLQAPALTDLHRNSAAAAASAAATAAAATATAAAAD
ncbi:unnamed protein product [Gadus morhua 'NCC']